ncbi:MAG: hypothetical protein QW416_00710 [Candidatus Nitrosocaldaceae archaeon]
MHDLYLKKEYSVLITVQSSLPTLTSIKRLDFTNLYEEDYDI